ERLSTLLCSVEEDLGQTVMSTATAVKLPPGEQETLSTGDRSEIGQRGWRGLRRAHACMAKRLDAALDQAHGLPMSSYEVLHHLDVASGGGKGMVELAAQGAPPRARRAPP